MGVGTTLVRMCLMRRNALWGVQVGSPSFVGKFILGDCRSPTDTDIIGLRMY